MSVEGPQLLLGPLAGAGGSGEDERAQLLVAVTKDVAGDLEPPPTVRLAGYAPASTVGCGYWMWIRGGGGVGISTRSIRHRATQTSKGPGPTGRSERTERLGSPPVRLAAGQWPRSAGVQLHPTSLPAGRLGRDAYAWVDWLAAAGQTWWQMLPLSAARPLSLAVKARSAFAAWPGLLAEPAAPVREDEELDLREREAGWIEGWAAVAGRSAVADQVRFFERELVRAAGVCRHARRAVDRRRPDRSVAPGSADQRAHPELFRDDAVACGMPPDAFTDKGQLWGNPLYDWPALRRRRYALAGRAAAADGRPLRPRPHRPLPRLRRLLGGAQGRAPCVRAAAARPRARRLRRGGRRARRAAAIAEDLGVITPAVDRLRTGLGLPGMAVLQWGFDEHAATSVHAPANHTEDRIAYTGTHDNDTLRGWYESIDPATRARADAARPASPRNPGGTSSHCSSPPRPASRWCRRRTCSGWGARRG